MPRNCKKILTSRIHIFIISESDVLGQGEILYEKEMVNNMWVNDFDDYGYTYCKKPKQGI